MQEKNIINRFSTLSGLALFRCLAQCCVNSKFVYETSEVLYLIDSAISSRKGANQLFYLLSGLIQLPITTATCI